MNYKQRECMKGINEDYIILEEVSDMLNNSFDDRCN